MEVPETPLLDVIHRSIAAHPRSLQKLIGPSEIGIDCDITLLHKLNGDEEPPRGPAWKPAIGTALHAQFEEWFQAENRRLGRERWITERRVTVGEIGGQPISGTCDLLDADTAFVWDWKFIGARQLEKYRTGGPSQQYRVQTHLYGMGYLRDYGVLPTEVGIAFMPREGELGKAYFWHEPWQPNIALDALNHVNGLLWQLQETGLETALTVQDPCSNPYCDWCRPLRKRTRPPGVSLFADA